MFKKSEVVTAYNDEQAARLEREQEKERQRQIELAKIRIELKDYILEVLESRTLVSYRILTINGKMSATTDVAIRAKNDRLFSYVESHMDDKAREILGAEIAAVSEWEECSIHIEIATDYEITLNVAFSGSV